MCAANVCRSPTAAKLFTADLPDSLAHELAVESAGVAVEPGSPWCPTAKKWVKRHRGPIDLAGEHSSRWLTADGISGAHLILAADVEVKSVVLRADLEARTKLFTLLEAAMLARGVAAGLGDSHGGLASANVLELEDLPRKRGGPRLSWLVAEMDAARGLVVPVRRGRRAGTMDILDPHSGRRGASHRIALQAVSDAVLSLGASMRDVNSA